MLFADLSLARRLEMTHAWRCVEYARAQQALHPDIPVQVEPVAGGYLVYAGDNSPLKRAVGLGFRDPVTRADLDYIERFYRDRNALPMVDLCPLADRSLADLLKVAGYRLEGFFNVLVCSLTEDLVPVSVPEEVQVRQVGTQDAELWLRTVAQGFGEQETPAQRTLDISAPNFYAANGACYLAWANGQPAGGGGMYVHEGVVEFGGASTRPGFRRRGVHAALLQARLRAAREQGCELAMVLTSPGSDSQRNVERAGFRLAYTKAVLVGA